ncbi:hypothetical protein A2625_04070 [candidate division WOR-1 bacterium RIFCSPHIGHO2_01_FULL_53_15]|uniref:Uncharacterized protein n=1 Tax=candidate division WOR-1 bacterium RIFCSPHIGHO2_01_FULL_53_15 TaxID=1802564 RepID=A0A1F4Q047_UNCSA|nr:MAG: hypothetical protein A2625_04070 [candidate division WOR-1 bacterium RIFCSPHIGHO2_01_FULL_53_15]OGC12946.1 MAG: hypothetical protein A3D23_05100 [candidate division WOR-1 bacterium RIFCSPHIGHO2_02_FULL_53_26]
MIGESINSAFEGKAGIKVVRDEACGGKQHIPLFLSENKKRENVICNVDLMVIKDNHISIIIEIEESNVKPTQICGKYLTSAISVCYFHAKENNKPVRMSKNVLFIQVLDNIKLPKGSVKIPQWIQIGERIKKVISDFHGTSVNKYELLFGNKGQFSGLEKALINKIEAHLT